MTDRRQFVGNVLKISALSLAGPKIASAKRLQTPDSSIKHLMAANDNGIRLPKGFKSRIVASAGIAPSKKSKYQWHQEPDGGAVYQDFSRDNLGGWIYACNEETKTGGVGALKFNAHGEVIDAYRILDNTLYNCAGGKTPWNTWLSGEETPYGRVWECDPYGNNQAQPINCLGSFKHEACAVDPINRTIYLTEDEKNGRFYRTVLPKYPSYEGGKLQVAEVQGDVFSGKAKLIWHDVPQPNPKKPEQETRYQIKKASIFNGGEGIWYYAGFVYFSTKGDERIWSLDLDNQTIKVIYDLQTTDFPVLSGVDNITVDNNGIIYVGEDGGNMQVVMLNESGQAIPLLQIDNQDKSEITGVAFTNDGSRMYFNSQRGPGVFGQKGITYEITGPFEQLRQLFTA